MDAQEEVDLDAALEVAVGAAKKAAKTMMQGFRATKRVKTKMSFRDLVTEYDKKTEDVVTSEIRKAYPKHRFIGEETSSTHPTLTAEPSWIIDPIDGTANYIHGFPESCISIALVLSKDIKVGVVYNPISDNLFTVIKGKGAFQNGKRIFASKCTELKKSLICPELTSSHKFTIEKFRRLASKVHGIRSTGSAALSLCYVANGSIDAYQQDLLQCWDVAAGALLVREAGGVVVSSNGEPFDVMNRKLLAVSTQPLADAYLQEIKEAEKAS